MKKVFPVVLSPAEVGYIVYVPDLDINTEGKDLADAVAMARDAIAMTGICMQDDGRSIPEPGALTPDHNDNEVVTLVDVDFDAYRKAHDNRTVRKNLTLPSWLNEKAEAAGVNFSAILQEGLKEYLSQRGEL